MRIARLQKEAAIFQAQRTSEEIKRRFKYRREAISVSDSKLLLKSKPPESHRPTCRSEMIKIPTALTTSDSHISISIPSYSGEDDCFTPEGSQEQTDAVSVPSGSVLSPNNSVSVPSGSVLSPSATVSVPSSTQQSQRNKLEYIEGPSNDPFNHNSAIEETSTTDKLKPKTSKGSFTDLRDLERTSREAVAESRFGTRSSQRFPHESSLLISLINKGKQHQQEMAAIQHQQEMAAIQCETAADQYSEQRLLSRRDNYLDKSRRRKSVLVDNVTTSLAEVPSDTVVEEHSSTTRSMSPELSSLSLSSNIFRSSSSLKEDFLSPEPESLINVSPEPESLNVNHAKTRNIKQKVW